MASAAQSAGVHKDLVAADFHGIGFHPHPLVPDYFASGDVKLPAVPRASHDLAFELAFPERPCFMEAYPADCTELTGDIRQRHGFPADLKLADLPYWDVALARRPLKSHSSAPWLYLRSQRLRGASSCFPGAAASRTHWSEPSGKVNPRRSSTRSIPLPLSPGAARISLRGPSGRSPGRFRRSGSRSSSKISARTSSRIWLLCKNRPA